MPYRRYAPVLKWLTLALFAYVATAFTVQIPWATRCCRDLAAPHSSNAD